MESMLEANTSLSAAPSTPPTVTGPATSVDVRVGHRLESPSSRAGSEECHSAQAVPHVVDEPVHHGRTEYTKDDIAALLREVTDLNPYMAPYGQKGTIWSKLHGNLKANGRFTRTNVEGVKKKVDEAIAWHEVRLGFSASLDTYILILPRIPIARRHGPSKE